MIERVIFTQGRSCRFFFLLVLMQAVYHELQKKVALRLFLINNFERVLRRMILDDRTLGRSQALFQRIR